MERPSVSDAVSQIAEIHGQIAKGEVYRGWRAVPVALSGVIGLAAAWLQRPTLGSDDPVGFVIYWTATAVAAAAAGASEIIYAAARQTAFERRQTERVALQFLPPLAVAVLATVTFVRLSAALVALLPGLWALLFGLAVFAARPYLPRPSAWVAWYYVASGSFLLWSAHTPVVQSAWAVGGVFGAGQLFGAAVIYWNLERRT